MSENRRRKNEKKAAKRAAAAAAAAAEEEARGANEPTTAASREETPRETAHSDGPLREEGGSHGSVPTRGRNAGGEGGALWRYDPAADAYTWLAALPLPEWYGFAAAAHGGWVYAVGGSTGGRWTGAAYRYRVEPEPGEPREGQKEAGGWEELPPMKMVRRRTAAAAVAVPKRR